MSNFKILFRRFFSNSCQRSQEKMLQHFRSVAKLKGGVSQCVKLFSDQFSILKAYGMQCNVIAAHRVRRTAQIMQLYRDLYGGKSAEQVLKQLRDLIKQNPKDKMFFLLGAAFFDWKGSRLTDMDLDLVEDELTPFFDCKATEPTFQDHNGEVWEKLLDNQHFKLWRCPVKGSSLYKYKVYGTYTDIPAEAFFNIQLDLEYRKQWDNHVIKLEKVEEDALTGSQVIYWATHFPLGFLYNRDYVFVRRFKVDEEQKLMMLTSHSVEHPKYPITSAYVRVGEYMSQMLIKPHKSFTDNGFDYVMSYYDNPHLYVPTWAINKMTVQSLPAFLAQLHDATVKLVNSNVKINGYRHQVHQPAKDSPGAGSVATANYMRPKVPNL